MDDLISRQAAIEAVEFGITYAKRINKETGEVTALFEESNAELEKAIDRIKQLPSAQPDIVRCGECKHYQFADNRAFGFPVKRCEWTGFEDVDEDDFCSRGEREEVTE